MTEDKSFTFRLPAELLAELHRVAVSQDLSTAQLIRRELRAFVASVKEVG